MITNDEARIYEQLGNVTLLMARLIFPEGDPQRLFTEWLIETPNLRQGCIDLGIDPPIGEGGLLFNETREAVIPVLVQRYRDGRK